MKSILLLFLLFPTFVSFAQQSAQDSIPIDSIIKLNKDKFTGREIYRLREPIVIIHGSNATGFDVTSENSNKRITIITITKDANCINEDNEIYFLFDDGVTIKATNIYGFNCQGISMATLLDKPKLIKRKDLIEEFKSNLLTGLRIESVSTYYDFDIPKEKAQVIQRVIEHYLSSGKKAKRKTRLHRQVCFPEGL